MGASWRVDGVRALAQPIAARAGLVVEDITVVPAGRRRVLRLVVDLSDDTPGGVPLDAVAVVSQELSAALDASDAMGSAPYLLEVSSPGVDRPLTQRRHWSRARGRLVVVALRDGGEVRGRLVGADDEGIALEEGRHLPWSEVAKGRVEVEFARDGESGPSSAPDRGRGG